GAAEWGEKGAGGGRADDIALVLLARQEQRRRQHPIVKTLLLAVDVGDEDVERGDALLEAGLEPLPLARGHDARHEIEGEDPLQPLLFPVDRERDALVDERELLQALATVDLFLRERFEDGEEAAILGTRGAVPIEGLVERGAALVRPFHGRENSTAE